MSSLQQRMSMMTVKNPNRSTVQASSTSTSSYSAPSRSTEAAMIQQQQQQQQQQRKKQEDQFKCPRCDSSNTKFCYYNNYSLSQPRHFCKACKRYWTRGGTIRSVPVGGGCRKNKRRIKNKRNSSTSCSKASSSSSLLLPPLYLTTTDSNTSPNSLFYGLSSPHISLPVDLVRPVSDMYQLPHELMSAVALSGLSDNFHPNTPFSDHNTNPPTTFLSTHGHYSSYESGTAASFLASRLRQPKKIEIEIEGYLPMMPFKEDLQVCSNDENLGLMKDHVKIEGRGEISDVLVDESIFEWPMNQFQPFTAAADATESVSGISDSSYHLLWNSEAWPDALGNSSLAPMI